MNSNQNNNVINRYDKTTSLVEVLNRLKDIIKNELHVATLALFKNVVQPYDEELKYGIIDIVPIPLNTNEKSISQQCYYFKDEDFEENQILTVIYTDLDFNINLKASVDEPIINQNPKLHSKESAVLVTTNYTNKHAHKILFDSSSNKKIGELAYNNKVTFFFESTFGILKSRYNLIANSVCNIATNTYTTTFYYISNGTITKLDPGNNVYIYYVK